MSSKFIEAQRKRFNALKTPILKKRFKAITRFKDLADKIKLEIAVYDQQIQALEDAEKALSGNMEFATDIPAVLEDIPENNATDTNTDTNTNTDTVDLVGPADDSNFANSYDTADAIENNTSDITNPFDIN